jgi:signal transduction histidine kinase/CheY-like chemotaxis protein/HAMP domain-containing protein
MARRLLIYSNRVLDPMMNFSSLRVRLIGTVFLAIVPVWVLMYFTDVPWAGFALGLLAATAAWYGGERFILRQVHTLAKAAQRLAEGDLSTRTGLAAQGGELGQLAGTFDSMAQSLENRVKEREQSERTLLNRSFQQTVVGALGQFAMVSNDLSALMNQVVMLVAQTLEVEYCGVLELVPTGKFLSLRSGVGWKSGSVGKVIVPADASTQSGFTLSAGEPVVVEFLPHETRFRGSPFMIDHGVISGITVVIAGHGEVFGVLEAHTTHRRRFTEDEVHFLLSVATVVAMAVERNKAETELQKLASFTQLNPSAVLEITPDEKVTYFNDAALKQAISVGHAHPNDILPPNAGEIVQTCLVTRHSKLRVETEIGRRNFSWSFHPMVDTHVVHCYVEDITERLNLEAQLRQAQKMESVGQLAAGVAHDFNNMLTVIQGHAGIMIKRTGLPPEMVESAQAILFAAERAASLTRQLLLFSRKSVMQTKLLDLREVVGNMTKMLQRLLGETVSLQFRAPPEIPLVQADPGMIEQILMNLAVNARDAMPKGGSLRIAIASVAIHEKYVQQNPEAREGAFICLGVQDTGCGMDSATMRRIFEPFFTTKEVGKGTGLGLATVYGIVKQHKGWIDVSSEPGQGTTFHVFFPASSEPVQAKSAEADPESAITGGKETILVVEDEPVLRDLANVILEDCGYNILQAGSGREALEIWEREANNIDLLLSDMIMPEGISGMDLAQRLQASKPELKIIFASGYSMDDLDTEFVRDGHAVFLQKPYTHLTLARAVRDCLDTPRKE